MENGEWRCKSCGFVGLNVTIQSPRNDSLSQPAAASSLGEGAWTGAWTGPQKPPSLREVGREAGRKESATEQLPFFISLERRSFAVLPYSLLPTAYSLNPNLPRQN